MTYYIWVGSMLNDVPTNLNHINLNKYLVIGALKATNTLIEVKELFKSLGGTLLSFDTDDNKMEFLDFMPYGVDTRRYFFNEDCDLRSSFETNNGSFARARQSVGVNVRPAEHLFCNTEYGAFVRSYSAGKGVSTIRILNEIDKIRFGA